MASITLRKIRARSSADADAISVCLFQDEGQRVCGWFIGPVRLTAAGIDMAYLPRSERTIASVAVVRAMEAAEKAELPLCVVDPDDLWGLAWRS